MTSVRITPLTVGKLNFDLSAIYKLPSDHPYAGKQAILPMRSFLIALPGRSVLVDAAGYDVNHLSSSMRIPGYSPPPSLTEQLVAAGIEPEAICDVIITHAHYDHYSDLTRPDRGDFVPAFLQARHYLGAADWDPDDFHELENQTLVVIERHGLLTKVEGTLDLGDGLVIRPAPGETAGHQILVVGAEDYTAYFTGDLFHHPLEFAADQPDVYWADSETMPASKIALMEMASASGGLVYFTHIEGAWRVIRSGESWLWQPA